MARIDKAEATLKPVSARSAYPAILVLVTLEAFPNQISFISVKAGGALVTISENPRQISITTIELANTECTLS